jgi:hypothetical protein
VRANRSATGGANRRLVAARDARLRAPTKTEQQLPSVWKLLIYNTAFAPVQLLPQPEHPPRHSIALQQTEGGTPVLAPVACVATHTESSRHRP